MKLEPCEASPNSDCGTLLAVTISILSLPGDLLAFGACRGYVYRRNRRVGLAFELLERQTSHSGKRRSENPAELEKDPLVTGSSNSPSHRYRPEDSVD